MSERAPSGERRDVGLRGTCAPCWAHPPASGPHRRRIHTLISKLSRLHDPAMVALPSARRSSSIAPPRRVGRYELLAELGRGGMASVYLARGFGSAGFERLAAMKLLHRALCADQDFVEMFLDEARVAARLHHPNAAAIIDVGADGSAALHGDGLRRGRHPPRRAARRLRAAPRGAAGHHPARGARRARGPRRRARARAAPTARRSGSSTATSRRTTSSSASTASRGSWTSASPARPRAASASPASG